MLSVAIMAHPDRRRFVGSLARQLPEAEVIWDREGDRWETGRRALLAFDQAATHHLVIQDDAVLCRDLVAGMARAAEVAAEHPVSLYTGAVRPHQAVVGPAVEQARREGRPWISMEGPFWGVGLLIPAVHIPELVAYCDGKSIANYDLRIWKFYKSLGRRCWYTAPSLVDHRPVAENPSLVPGRDGNRRALWFIGARRSALEIDWTQEPVEAGQIVSFRQRQSERTLRVRRGSTRYERLLADASWTIHEAV